MNARNLAKYLMLVLTFMLLTVAVSAQDDAADDGLYTGAELQTTIQEVVNNDTELVGQTVTVEGVVSELVNVRAFTLREDAVIDADGVLVINNTGQPFDLNVTADDRFLVTGIVHNPIEEVYGNEVTDYDREYYQDYFDDLRVEDENLALYEDAFEEYRNWTVIEVTVPGNIVPAVTLEELAAGAEPYDDGRVYAIEGYVNDIVNDNLFIMGEDAAIANARVLVFAPGATDLEENVGVTEFGLDYDTLYEQDYRVRVYGTISAVGDADFVDEFDQWNEEYGLDYDTVYDEEALVEYDLSDWEAVYANLIVPIPAE